MSHCRKHNAPQATEPHTLNKKYNTKALLAECGSTRNNPKDPSFKRIPASAILPTTGASTCALGSHKCTPYIGLFTINAMVIAIAATPPGTSTPLQAVK